MPGTLIRQAGEGGYEAAEPGITIRDLGVTDATGGDYTLLLVRIEPEGAQVEELHRHDEGFSLAYVLSGWLQVEFAEIGVQTLPVGTVIPAFNGPTHRELDAGDGLELLLLVTANDMIGHDNEKIVLRFEDETPYQDDVAIGFRCRDFDLAELTGGRLTARALRPIPGVETDHQWHQHDYDAQFLYVAEGWFDVEYADSGIVRLEPGAMVLQRPGVPHIVRGHSDDLLLIEMTLPATFETEIVAGPAEHADSIAG